MAGGEGVVRAVPDLDDAGTFGLVGVDRHADVLQLGRNVHGAAVRLGQREPDEAEDGGYRKKGTHGFFSL